MRLCVIETCFYLLDRFPLNLTSTPLIDPANDAEWEKVSKTACPNLIGEENLGLLHDAWGTVPNSFYQLSHT